MNGLGKIYDLQGHHDEAATVFEEVLEIERRVMGDEHPATLLDTVNLALMYQYQKRYDEAESLYDRVL